MLAETLRELADLSYRAGGQTLRPGAPLRCPVESCGAAILNGDIIALTDPPDPLTNVAGPWRLVLEPGAAIVHG
jgi:hypothetical protein